MSYFSLNAKEMNFFKFQIRSVHVCLATKIMPIESYGRKYNVDLVLAVLFILNKRKSGNKGSVGFNLEFPGPLLFVVLKITLSKHPLS